MNIEHFFNLKKNQSIVSQGFCESREKNFTMA